LGCAVTVSELVEDCNLHGALVQVAVAADEFFGLRDVVVARVGLHLVEDGVFGLERAVDLEEHLQHAEVVLLLELSLFEMLTELVRGLVGIDCGELLNDWLLGLSFFLELVF